MSFPVNMEGCSKKGTITCPQLLDLIPKEREWAVKRGGEHVGSSEERKLELRLGPPGHEDWSRLKDTNTNNVKEKDESLLSLGYFSSSSEKSSVWFHHQQQQQQQQQQQGKAPYFLQSCSSSQMLPVTGKDSSQPCCTKVVPDLPQNNSPPEKKAFSLPLSPPPAPNTAVPYSSQKRTAPGPVVGWPPIRSFRKNLASTSSSKQALETQTENPNKKFASEIPDETNKKGLFVKINMDGIPIGRKVDLKAYDSYEKLSTAVDELFRGLLGAQRDSCAGGMMNKQEEDRKITGVLGGSGEYTLVYEDNEGDSMLVGDVPWLMFVSTVKRLRVLKSSEVSALSLGSSSSRQTRLRGT